MLQAYGGAERHLKRDNWYIKVDMHTGLSAAGGGHRAVQACGGSDRHNAFCCVSNKQQTAVRAAADLAQPALVVMAGGPRFDSGSRHPKQRRHDRAPARERQGRSTRRGLLPCAGAMQSDQLPTGMHSFFPDTRFHSFSLHSVGQFTQSHATVAMVQAARIF